MEIDFPLHTKAELPGCIPEVRNPFEICNTALLKFSFATHNFLKRFQLLMASALVLGDVS